MKSDKELEQKSLEESGLVMEEELKNYLDKCLKDNLLLTTSEYTIKPKKLPRKLKKKNKKLGILTFDVKFFDLIKSIKIESVIDHE